jgi:hypothetical protein
MAMLDAGSSSSSSYEVIGGQQGGAAQAAEPTVPAPLPAAVSQPRRMPRMALSGMLDFLFDSKA